MRADDAQARQIDPRQARDLGVLHLHHDWRPVAQRRPVHLRERRGRQRRLVDCDEDLVERTTELALDLRRISENGRGGTASWKRPSRRMKGSGKLSARGADDLAELHEESGQMDAEVVQAARHRSWTRSQVTGGAGQPSRSRVSSHR